jgi:hypothetical protein
VSHTVMRTAEASSFAVMPTCPPSGVNFTALDSRLKTTCLTLRSSASMTSIVGSTSKLSAMPWRLLRSRTMVRPFSKASESEKRPSSISI